MSITDLQLRPGYLELSRKQYDDMVLDASASMMDQWDTMLHAIDTYVETLTHQQIDTHLRLATFTTPVRENLDVVVRNCPISDWVSVRARRPKADFHMTPLYDAICATGWRLRELQPEKAAITFFTDGGEQGSTTSKLENAQAIIKWMQANGWQVTFIGCDFNNASLAQSLGVRATQAIGVASAQMADAISELARKRAKYALDNAPMHWSDEDRAQFGGYLAAK